MEKAEKAKYDLPLLKYKPVKINMHKKFDNEVITKEKEDDETDQQIK